MVNFSLTGGIENIQQKSPVIENKRMLALEFQGVPS